MDLYSLAVFKHKMVKTMAAHEFIQNNEERIMRTCTNFISHVCEQLKQRDLKFMEIESMSGIKLLANGMFQLPDNSLRTSEQVISFHRPEGVIRALHKQCDLIIEQAEMYKKLLESNGLSVETKTLPETQTE